MADEMRTCRICGETKAITLFYKKAENHRWGGRARECKDCKLKTEEFRKWGFTYGQLVEIYGNSCGICGQDENILSISGNIHRLCVDHDHACCEFGCHKCIRGLLCRGCNYRLGVFESQPDWLDNAFGYLQKGRKLPKVIKRKKCETISSSTKVERKRRALEKKNKALKILADLDVIDEGGEYVG